MRLPLFHEGTVQITQTNRFPFPAAIVEADEPGPLRSSQGQRSKGKGNKPNRFPNPGLLSIEAGQNRKSDGWRSESDLETLPQPACRPSQSAGMKVRLTKRRLRSKAIAQRQSGWVAEWTKAAVLKTAVRESVPGVRIPPHPLPPPGLPGLRRATEAIRLASNAPPGLARPIKQPLCSRATPGQPGTKTECKPECKPGQRSGSPLYH